MGNKTDLNSKSQTVPKPLPANKETYLAKLYADKRAPIHLSVGRVCTGCKHKWSTNDIGASNCPNCKQKYARIQSLKCPEC